MSDPSLQQTDLGIGNFAVSREGFGEAIAVGGPGKATDEAPVLSIGRGHRKTQIRDGEAIDVKERYFGH